MIKIIGDIMLDRWIVGDASRISPEAPVPVLKQTEIKTSPGGAANLAMNLNALCDELSLTGVVGFDKNGATLMDHLSKTNMDCYIAKDGYVTTTKTRLVSQGGQHLCRWDEETKYDLDIEPYFFTNLEKNDIVIISDYNKGVINETVFNKIKKSTDKIFVDPKQGPDVYEGAWLVKPNMLEYEQWFGKYDQKNAVKMCLTYNWAWLVVTDGAKGVHVVNMNGDYWHFHEPAREVADVTGAGDTFLAVLVHAYVNKGLSIPHACELACFASTKMVQKRGVAVVTPQDLNRGVVFTNGVFDILHPGHLELLKYAKNLGNKLIVAINDDESVKRLKGPDRPVNDFIARKKQLEALPWVDQVIVFCEDTPLETIQAVLPDIIVKGGDYTVETTVGHELAEVKIFPRVEGHSTSDIIERIKH